VQEFLVSFAPDAVDLVGVFQERGVIELLLLWSMSFGIVRVKIDRDGLAHDGHYLRECLNVQCDPERQVIVSMLLVEKTLKISDSSNCHCVCEA